MDTDIGGSTVALINTSGGLRGLRRSAAGLSSVGACQTQIRCPFATRKTRNIHIYIFAERNPIRRAPTSTRIGTYLEKKKTKTNKKRAKKKKEIPLATIDDAK